MDFLQKLFNDVINKTLQQTQVKAEEVLDQRVKDEIEENIKVIIERAKIIAFVKRLANRSNISEANRMTLLMAAKYIDELHHRDDIKLYGPEEKDGSEICPHIDWQGDEKN